MLQFQFSCMNDPYVTNLHSSAGGPFESRTSDCVLLCCCQLPLDVHSRSRQLCAIATGKCPSYRVTEKFCSQPVTRSNKLSPYLREEVCTGKIDGSRGRRSRERLQVSHVSNKRRGRGCVSSNCCRLSRCEGTLGVVWVKKNPNCTSVCKGSWSVCTFVLTPGCHTTSFILHRSQTEYSLDGENFQDVSNTFLGLQLR